MSKRFQGLWVLGTVLVMAASGWSAELAAFEKAPEAVRAEAMALVRAVVESYRQNGPRADAVPASATLSAEWSRLPRTGLFVTLVRDRRVRGCMGALYAREPDWRSEIIHHALGALAQDTRFPIVDAGESKDFIVILSFVGTIRPLARLSELDPWHEGLLVEQEDRAAVLLPGEAKTARWEFAEACRKAGIDPALTLTMTRFSTTTWISEPEIASASQERSSP